MKCPSDRLYHREHLWVRQDNGEEAIVGVTDFAQERLSEVVYVGYPDLGTEIRQGSLLELLSRQRRRLISLPLQAA